MMRVAGSCVLLLVCTCARTDLRTAIADGGADPAVGGGDGGGADGGGADDGDAGGEADLDPPVPIRITTVRCTSGAGVYLEGNVLRVEVDFDAPVTVNGQPSLAVQLGASVRSASLSSSQAQRLLFTYPIAAGDADADGIEVLSPLDAAPDEIVDAGGVRPVELDFPPLSLPLVRVGGPVTVGGFVWIGGTTSTNVAPALGPTPDQPAATNDPGSRSGSVTWRDAQGHLWLFGGLTRSARGRNDLWRLEPGARLWAFGGGLNADNPDPVYTVGSEMPAGREEARGHRLADGRVLVAHGLTISTVVPTYRATNGLWAWVAVDATWAWLGGRDHYDDGNAVDWGTAGVEAATNLPGPRHGHCTWLDAAGRLWLFGGNTVYAPGSNGSMADLWRYDPVSTYWTYVGGPQTPTAPNHGTLGVEAAGNWPRGNYQATTCWATADGSLWLFGGATGQNIGRIGALWRYRPSTGQWTWMAGPSTTDTAGVYGTLGVPSAANQPGAREGAAGWVDGRDDLWLFGGYGFDETGTRGRLNDLWRFHVPSSTWSWIAGSKVADDAGSYGALDVAAPSNLPPARARALVWQVGDAVWLFGGSGTATLHDLWRLDP